MALNFSHRPIFAAHISEDNLMAPIRIVNGCLAEGIPDKNLEGYGRPWHPSGDYEDCFDYGRARCDRGGSQEAVSKDVLDLLPSDPFGMDISTTVTAITGWLEDLEADYGGYGSGEIGGSNDSYQLFADLNFIWNNAMRFQAYPYSIEVDNKLNPPQVFGGLSERAGFASCSFGSMCNLDEFLSGPNSSTFDVCSEKAGVSSCDGGHGSIGNLDEFLGSHNCSVRTSNDFSEKATAGCIESELQSTCNFDELLGETTSRARSFGQPSGEHRVFEMLSEEDTEASPHPALFFALGYLSLRDLLLVESVCKSLHLTVRGDPLLWRTIRIDQPLNEKITDNVLLQLTRRAHGNLQCLSLVECPRITDDGLRRVLETNPKLTKLCVPGCTRLNIEGIIRSLMTSKSNGTQGVKQLRIGGLYGVTQQHFEALNLLLGTETQLVHGARRPRFYHRGNVYLSSDDDCAIDIEMCPRCQNFRLVYDCPAEGCKGKGCPTQECRACTLCIARCAQCGRCINDSEYEETFCLELLCSGCWKQLLSCHEGQDRKIGLPLSAVLNEQSGESIFHHG